MSEPRFFEFPESIVLKMVAEWAGAEIYRGDEDLEISDVAPLEDAGSWRTRFF